MWPLSIQDRSILIGGSLPGQEPSAPLYRIHYLVARILPANLRFIFVARCVMKATYVIVNVATIKKKKYIFYFATYTTQRRVRMGIFCEGQNGGGKNRAV